VAQVVEDVTLAPRSPEARMPVRTPLAGGKTTALGGAASNPPGAVFGSDGREHVEYVVLTNAFSGDATLGAVSVRADDGPAPTLAGDEPAAVPLDAVGRGRVAHAAPALCGRLLPGVLFGLLAESAFPERVFAVALRDSRLLLRV